MDTVCDWPQLSPKLLTLLDSFNMETESTIMPFIVKFSGNKAQLSNFTRNALILIDINVATAMCF